MKRLSWLMLTIFMVLVFAVGCGSNRTDENRVPAVNSSSTTTSDQKTGELAPETSKATVNQVATAENNKVTEEKTVSNAASTASTATLLITSDFGCKILFNKKVSVDNSPTVLDVLKANLDIKTKWDGSYVSNIMGMETHNGGIAGNNMDWFYYVNGICCDSGAADYNVKPGEVIWWDYHKWQNTGFANSAVIGSYPEPFIHGFRGKVGTTTVMSSAENLQLAHAMEQALKNQGVYSITTMEFDNNWLAKAQQPTIIVGTWDELKKLEYLESFNKAYRKTGASVHFTDQGIELLNYKGDAAQTVERGVGVIVASGSGLGDDSPLWLIAGTDQEGLQQAIDLLIKNPQQIFGFYNTAIISGDIIRLPLQ